MPAAGRSDPPRLHGSVPPDPVRLPIRPVDGDALMPARTHAHRNPFRLVSMTALRSPAPVARVNTDTSGQHLKAASYKPECRSCP